MKGDKSFSGEQSYHDMLRAAQSYCPALTYVLCKLLLSVKINERKLTVSSKCLDVDEGFGKYFRSNPERSRMDKFLQEIFHDQTVTIGGDGSADRRKLVADTQFVQWLQDNKVVLDDTKKLVAIKL